MVDNSVVGVNRANKPVSAPRQGLNMHMYSQRLPVPEMIVAEHLSARFRLDDETTFEPQLTEEAIHSMHPSCLIATW